MPPGFEREIGCLAIASLGVLTATLIFAYFQYCV